MENSVIVLFRKLVGLGIFNTSWTPIQSRHYLIGIFDNKIYIGVLITSNKAYNSTHMVTLSASEAELKIVFEEAEEVFEQELENILQAMIDVYPAEVGEISALGFSSMVYPNVQSLIGKLDEIGDRLGNPLIKLRREGKEINVNRHFNGFSNEAQATEEVIKQLQGSDKLLVDLATARTDFFEANPGLGETLANAQRSVPGIVEALREHGTRINQGDYVIAQLWDKLLRRQLFVANRLPYVTQDGQVAVFVSRLPFLISVCTNTGNVLEVPAGHLEGSGTGFKRICWIRNGRVTWAKDAVQVVDGEFGYPQLEATLRGLLVSLEGLDQDPLGRGLTTEAAMRLMVEQNPHLYTVDPVARDAYIAKMKKELPGLVNDDGGIDVVALAAKAQRKSKTLAADPGFARWAPGPKGYIPRETFGSDTEAYITHLERVIEISRMTPAEFMEDAKRSAKELEQMYPEPARLIDPLPRHPHTDFYFPHQVDLSALDGVDVERQIDWTAIVTPPTFMGKAPSKFTLSMPRDPLFDSFANSEFFHNWAKLIHTTNETFRLEGTEHLSSVELSIYFEVPGEVPAKLVVRPTGEHSKFYLEEDRPKGARLAELTLERDRITVEIPDDEVFPIAGAEQVLVAMLKAVKEHMTK